MSNKRPKINFICPGAPKAGTTALYEILKQHPQIYLPKIKETNFFGIVELYDKGLDWYFKEYFHNIDEGKLCGDISTSYMQYAKAAAPRIAEKLGCDIKIIFMMRDPAERAYSHYKMAKYNNGRDEPTFRDLVFKLTKNKQDVTENEYNEISKGYGYNREQNLDKWRYVTYFDNGFYGDKIEEFLKYFDRDNMLFLTDRMLKESQEETIMKIYSFLKLDNNIKIPIGVSANESGKIKYPIVHRVMVSVGKNRTIRNILQKIIGYTNLVRAYYFIKNINRVKHKTEPLDQETRKTLNQFYREDHKKLESIIGRSLCDWN